jgi:hypothetical protein
MLVIGQPGLPAGLPRQASATSCLAGDYMVIGADDNITTVTETAKVCTPIPITMINGKNCQPAEFLAYSIGRLHAIPS